jgi:hypothetical protein
VYSAYIQQDCKHDAGVIGYDQLALGTDMLMISTHEMGISAGRSGRRGHTEHTSSGTIGEEVLEDMISG